MYLIYAADGATAEWLWWNDNTGWGDLESAEVYDFTEDSTEHVSGFAPLEGEWLYIGDTALKPLAAIILDLEVVLARHTDTNLASKVGRLALAGWLAQGLQLATEGDGNWEIVCEKGYELRTYKGI